MNAIVARLDDDACLAAADAADARTARADPLPPLHGLPIAFKDLQPAKGFPCDDPRVPDRGAVWSAAPRTPHPDPIGSQIVGRFRDDFGVLQLAHAVEEATRTGRRRPALCDQ